MEKNRNIKYTKIEINSPSKYFTQDLWVKDKAPIKTYYFNFIANYTVLIAIFLFILSSVLSGMVAGMIVFKNLRKNPIKLGFIGLSNCLTIYGLIATIILIKVNHENEEIIQLITKIKQKGYYKKRRIANIFFVLAILVFIFGISFFNPLDHYLIFFVFFYIAASLLVVFGFIYLKVKTEDKYLFEQLELARYSNNSSQPHSGRKIIFVPIFSFLFLIISWLLIKLIELTV